MSGLPASNLEELVRVGIDYGTGFLKLATQHIYPGRRQNAKDIFDVRLDNFNSAAAVAIEQIAIWPQNHSLIWGKRPVDRWIRKHPNEQGVVLFAWKLALMKQFKDREVVQNTVDALGCAKDHHSITSAVEIVITEHLRQIKSETLKWCKEKSPANMSRKPDWDHLPWEAQLAIPAMWSAEARGVMSRAAYKAGFKNVNLREEPQCVAGACMSDLRDQGLIDENDQVLFLDIGAGTSDTAIVRYRYDIEASAHMILERVGTSRGNDGGSLAVNNAGWRSFLEHDTVRQAGGVIEFCKRRNMTQEECQRQLSNEIERIKSQYDADGAFTYQVVINSTPALDTMAVGPTYIGFENDVVREWLDEWIRLNEELLDGIVIGAPDCHRAIFTGRGSDNNYLRNRLTRKLASLEIKVYDLNVDYPCSRGALLHYFFEEDQPKFSNATFYTTQSETFDRKIHTDIAAPTRRRRVGRGRKQAPPPTKRRAQPYKWDANELIVEDRLLPLMDIVDNERTNNIELPMQFDIDARFPARIHFDIFSTTQPHIHRAHGPLRDADGNVFESMTQYPIAFLDLPDLSQYFDPQPVGNSEEGVIYVVCGFVEMRKTGNTLKVHVKLLGHDFAWQYDQKGEYCSSTHAYAIAVLLLTLTGTFVTSQKYNPNQIIYKSSQRIWDPKCSSFIRGNVIDAQTARLDSGDGTQARQKSRIGSSSAIMSDYEDQSPILDRRKSRLAGRRSWKQTKGMSSEKVAQRWSRDG